MTGERNLKMTEQLPATVTVNSMPAGLEVPTEIQFELVSEEDQPDTDTQERRETL